MKTLLQKLWNKGALTNILLFCLVFGFVFAPVLTNSVQAQGAWDGLNSVAEQERLAAACTINTITTCINNFIESTVGYIINTILSLFALALWLSGVLFDYVIKFTVVDMANSVRSLKVIDTIWKIFRDLTNIFFIFALLYIGVMTVLNSSKVNWRKQVGTVIIAGLLINFSLFITKIPIDLSNIISLQFYKAMVNASRNISTPITGNKVSAVDVVTNLSSNTAGVSAAFMQYMRIQTVYSPSPATGILSGSADIFSRLLTLITKGLFGATIMLITACVFYTAAFMLIYRFFLLVFAMIISPLVFLGMVLPIVKSKISNKWGEYLVGQSLFAPVFFLLLYISLLITAEISNNLISKEAGGFANVGASIASFNSIISLIIGYLFIIGMIIGSIQVAKEMGAKGGDGFDAMVSKAKWLPTRWASKPVAAVSGAAYREYVGKNANKLANNTYLKKLAASDNPLATWTGARAGARGLQTGLKTTAETSGDFRNIKGLGGALGEGNKGYKAVEETNKKYKTELVQQERQNDFDKALAQLVSLQSVKTDDMLPANLSEHKTKVAKAKENLEHTLSKLGDSALDKVSPKKLNQIATALNAEQFNRLVKSDKSPLTDQEKIDLTEARLGGSVKEFKVPTKKEDFITDKESYSVNQLSTIIANTQDSEIREVAERQYASKINALEAKELETIAAYVFNNKDEKEIERFVVSLNQDKADKIKSIAGFTDSQKKNFKETRKKMMTTSLEEYKKAVGEIREIKKREVIKKLGKSDGDYLASLGGDTIKEIFDDPDLLSSIQGKKHLKKMFEKDFSETVKDDKGNQVSVHDYIATQVLKYRKDGKRHSAFKFFTNNDNLGTVNVDMDEIEAFHKDEADKEARAKNTDTNQAPPGFQY